MFSSVIRGRLPRIIRMFTQIRSFIFYGEGMEWDENQAETRLAILDLFRVQSLTDISISDVRGFLCLSVFTLSPQLRRLAFESVTPQNDNDTDASHAVITFDNPGTSGTDDRGRVAVMVRNQHAALPVESLDIRSESGLSGKSILRSLITQDVLPRLSSLRALRISFCTMDEVELVQKLLDNATDSLQDITFFISQCIFLSHRHSDDLTEHR
jgi:hypothetical protein